MTSPVLLTVPTPLDVRISVDCHPCHATSTNDTQRHVALPLDFGVLVDVPHPSPGLSVPSAPGSFSLSSAGTTPASISISVADTTHSFTTNAGTIHDANANANATLPSDSDCSDAHAYSDTHADPYTHTVVQRQWTGAPIRAIVPLPRRMRASPHGVAHLNVPASAWSHSHDHGHSHTAVDPPTRSIREDADADTDSDSEIKIEIVAPEQDEDEDDAEQRRTRSGYYSYESITAAEGLSAWSFEELRVECYAQSLVARGTRPSPAVQPSLAIPPAFVPRVIPRR